MIYPIQYTPIPKQNQVIYQQLWNAEVGVIIRDPDKEPTAELWGTLFSTGTSPYFVGAPSGTIGIATQEAVPATLRDSDKNGSAQDPRRGKRPLRANC